MKSKAKKILIIEDEKPMAKALELKLSKAGFETKAVFNGEDALQILEKEKFALIILDLVMPRINGFELLKEFQVRKIETPVIVTSNLSQDEDIMRAKELGADDYFVKSDTPIAKIVDHVKSLLNKNA